MIVRNTTAPEIHDHAAGGPVEHAAIRSTPAAAALRNAPEWVRRRIAEIRGKRLDDGTVERRGAIETAAEDRATAAAARSLAHAPARIIRRVNEHRRAQGLAEIHVAASEPRGSGVWLAGRGGTLRDATVALRTGTVVVGIVVDPNGVASARSINADQPEGIWGGAFGTADELNRTVGLPLHVGDHGSMPQAWAGRSLTFHDVDGVLAFVWKIETRNAFHSDAVAAVEAGRNGVSVKFIYSRRDTRQIAGRADVTRATLLHVALLTDGDSPAYPSCRAKVYRDIDTGDTAAIRAAITATIRHGRFMAERARR
jgi:hypothetical protein